MRGVSSNVNQRQIDGMTLSDMIEFVQELGYSTESLNNDEIYQLVVESLDGHNNESEVEELDFND